MSTLTNRYEDDDAFHLPPGMKRVGYDADTERYTFQQGEDLWLGEPGSFYGGKMKYAGKVEASDVSEESDEDDSDESSKEDHVPKKSHKHEINSRRVHTVGALPYTQRANNEWGVPITSISKTDARPPNSPATRRRKLFQKAANSTMTAISVTRQLSRKMSSSGRVAHSRNSIERERDEKLMVAPEVPEKDEVKFMED